MKKNNWNKNTTWLSWFVGFFEGDGNFQIHYKYNKVKSTEMLIDKKGSCLAAGLDIIKEKESPLDSKTRLGYSINISLSEIDLELLKDIKNYYII